MIGARHSDVIVVGGGLLGLFSALMLAERGRSVRLLEAGAVGREASWAGGGILWPLYAWRYPPAVQAMAALGRELYPELCAKLQRETGCDPQYRRSGMRVADAHAEAGAWCRRHGERHAFVEGAGVDSASLGSGGAQAELWLPDVAQLRNPRLCRALHQRLLALGVAVHEQTPVTAITTRNQAFAGVQTPAGRFDAECGVLAAGAWSARLAPQLDIFPVKGQMLLFRALPGQLTRLELGGGVYVIPRADGRVLVGSTVEHAGFDTSTDAATARSLHAGATRLAPALSGLAPVRHWAGLRPGTGDAIPYVGPMAATPGLFVNAGHYRNGVVTAPASAQLLAEVMGFGRSALDARAYSPARRRCDDA